MKKALITIILVAICSAGVGTYAFTSNRNTESDATRTVSQTAASTTLQSMATESKAATSTTTEKLKPTTTAAGTTAAKKKKPSTTKNMDELLTSLTSKYDIDDNYSLAKKTYDGGTEYYWEWVDDNGYHNMYDALRVHISDTGKITLEKRFDSKAKQGVIKFDKSIAIKDAGGGKITDTLYYMNEDMQAPRLAYKIVNGKYITYVDTENGTMLGGDMIK